MDEKKVLICWGGSVTLAESEYTAAPLLEIAKDAYGEDGVAVVNVTGLSVGIIALIASWYGKDSALGHTGWFKNYMREYYELVDTTKENWWDELKGVKQ